MSRGGRSLGRSNTFGVGCGIFGPEVQHRKMLYFPALSPEHNGELFWGSGAILGFGGYIGEKEKKNNS